MISFVLVKSEKLAAAKRGIAFELSDGTTFEAPIIRFDGNINNIRVELHKAVDTFCDRSNTINFLDTKDLDA